MWIYEVNYKKYFIPLPPENLIFRGTIACKIVNRESKIINS